MAAAMPLRSTLWPTGRAVAERFGCRVLLGDGNRYNFVTRCITLTQEVAIGRDPVSLLVAAHEAAHARQPFWRHCFRWFTPVRWLDEAEAWEEAVQYLADLSNESQNRL